MPKLPKRENWFKSSRPNAAFEAAMTKAADEALDTGNAVYVQEGLLVVPDTLAVEWAANGLDGPPSFTAQRPSDGRCVYVLGVPAEFRPLAEAAAAYDAAKKKAA
ncbi:hypothetical protein H181DRAFT_03146 [Streptomyces sp. WMMB 714]|uniref:hypothetical protein n=1 Tax=Streptomyces sp. WMMB 714 TaxID=1286822 RepID=UPI0005F7ADD6|nr:hypothetical protein [Streptomyces sp. WMMB 714]SCK37218.1 hypothetical protein H181DRAFT_03146 [Streptomyces sp. WMMB 714]